jgi:hypothetical protein
MIVNDSEPNLVPFEQRLYRKVDTDKLSGFKWISQGILENDRNPGLLYPHLRKEVCSRYLPKPN